MRIFDDKIVQVLNEGMKAAGDGHKSAASSLVRLLRSGQADLSALDELAAELAKTWGPEAKSYLRDLCRKAGICE